MLRFAVVGTGIMGASHARVAASLRDVELSYVVDPSRDRGEAVAAAVGAAYASSVDEVAGRIDAAVVATPTEHHVDLGVRLLEQGVHVLVEKPIAPSLAEAQRLVDTAARTGAHLMVGHIERFNPAVLELDRLVDGLLHVSAARVSPYSPRVRDDVVIDLMIHDIDIVLHIVGEYPDRVQAIGRCVHSDSEDLVAALLSFPSGITAELTASRIGQNKIRQLQLTQQENFVNVDLVRQDVTISRVDHSEFLSESGPRYRQSGVVEIPFLERRGEPLYLELEHFAQCILDGRRPAVSGADGVAALRLALEIKHAAAVEAAGHSDRQMQNPRATSSSTTMSDGDGPAGGPSSA